MNLFTIITLATASSSLAFSGITRIASDVTRSASLNDSRCDVDRPMPTRRETLQSWLVGAATLSTGFLASPEHAMAFPNKISNQYDDRPKQRGSKVVCFFALYLSNCLYLVCQPLLLVHHAHIYPPRSSQKIAILFTASRSRCSKAEGYDWRRIFGTQTLWRR